MGVMWTYVAWLLPTTLLLPAAAKGGAVDVRIAYLVFPIYNLTLVVLLTRYWYRLTWDEVSIPGKYLWGTVAVSLLLAIGYLLISLAAGARRRPGAAGAFLSPPVGGVFFCGAVPARFSPRQYNPHRAIVLTSFL